MEFFCDAFIFYLFLLKEHLQTLQKICLFVLSNLEWEQVKNVFQDIDMDQ